MRRRPLSAVPVLTVLALALTACSNGSVERAVKVEAAPAAVDVSSSPSPSPDPETSLAPEPSPSATASVSPSPSKSASSPKPKPSPKPVLAYDVSAVQRQLTDLRYFAGAIDGRPGPTLRSAVMAFQKVQGLRIDGVVGSPTLAALAAPKLPQLEDTAPADRVEVDLTKQVLYVVKGGKIARIMPVSSGNGATYTQPNSRAKARALTPSGYYTIERRIVGVREADLGTLYDPQYFYRGWAIHGSNSVPAGPASHGCVRVTRTDAKYLLQALTIGMSVHLYGGQFTFPAGSSAPGTDTPSGDTESVATPPPPARPSAPAPAPTGEPAAPPPPPAETPGAEPRRIPVLPPPNS